jgi:hypothetical protein
MKAVFMRVKGNNLVPVDPYAEQMLARCKIGEGLTVEATKTRNIRFHRKFFALLNLAFSMWDPYEDYIDHETGEIIVTPSFKDFDSFREEVLIMAGHCDQVFSLNGKSFKLRAKSISFAKCDEYEFERVYRNVLTVIWNRLLRDKQFDSPEAVDAVVMQLMGYE